MCIRWSQNFLRVALLTSVVSLAVPADGQPKPVESSAVATPLTGFLDFNGYYDSRNATGGTVNALANLTPSIQYFSLTNYVNAFDGPSRFDLESFYTEQNLRYSPVANVPFALSVQWVVKSGEANDGLRVGGIFKISQVGPLASAFDAMGLYYHVNVHAYQLDDVSDGGYRGQIEHIYQWKPWSHGIGARLYLAGFVDHNLTLGKQAAEKSIVITEHQLGIRVFKTLHAIVEYRYHEGLSRQNSGVGLGLQYVIPFRVKN